MPAAAPASIHEPLDILEPERFHEILGGADKSPHFVAVFSEKLNMKAGRREDFPEILLPAFM
jgi:hypothetical protein